ncbi:hypothetical protein MHYP_G00340380 [Metynnis hypsauchen]
MQSDETHTGGHSHLFNSMQKYLCSHDRVQPIVGLGSIIELCTDAEPPVYLCDVCILKINKRDIKTHIMGSLHRYNYIKSRHVYGLKAGEDLTSLAWRLMELAKVVEKKEGTGNVQVLHLDDIIYKEMLSKPALDAIAQVKKIKIQTRISGLQSSIFNKRTKCDSSTAALSPIWTSTTWSSKLRQSRNVSSVKVPCLTRSCSPGRMLPVKEAQSPVRYWMPAEILHPDGDSTLQSPVQKIIQARAPPGHTVSSEFSSPTKPISPTTAFSSGTAPRLLKRWSPVKASEQNAFMHADKADDVSRVIDTDRSFGTDLHLSNTKQTAKRKCEAHCQNSSLTINQKAKQENNSYQKISQGVNGTLPSVIPQDQDQCQDDPSVQAPFRKTVWLLNDSNGEQEELPQIRHFTPEDTYGFEHFSRYSVKLSQCELKDVNSQTCTVQSPKLSEESPESYRGTQPLIGLQAVIKCQSVDGDPPPCCYLCQPCSLKVLKSDIIHHLISPQHQLNYINFHHPHLLLDMDEDQSLQTIVMQLEQEGGRGQMKVTRLSACLLSEILEKDFDWCIKMLNCASTAEIKPEQGPLMARSSMSSGHNITLKRPYESTEITVDHSWDGTLHDHIGKVPCRQWSSSRGGVSLKKARHKVPVFKSDVTQVMLANHIPKQMFGERNCEVMNVPIHMYPAVTGACVPAINTYTSYPVQYVNQRWMWGSTDLSNQYNF